jgi:MazG family protein
LPARAGGAVAPPTPGHRAQVGGQAVARLDEVARLLRRECPWDREQDVRSIVPHTVEEAYELADAAHAGDDEKLLDELGDVLFQVHFLALLLEERGAGELAAVAERCREKLIRRHPHVFGEVEVSSAADVRSNWEEIKRGEGGRSPGPFGELPENLPALIHARRLQRRAEGAGRPAPDLAGALERVGVEARSLADAEGREERFAAVGRLLFAAVEAARAAGADPELALRAEGEEFRAEVERG